MSGGKLPEGWGKTVIGDIADVISGGTPKSGIAENFAPSGEGIAWLTPADLSGYKKKFISHGARDLSTEGYSSCSAKLMPAGAILFSSRAPIGYVAVASNEISTNQGFKSFVFTNDIYPDYAYYYLRNIRHLAEEMGTGTTFKEISGSAAKTLPFVMAPLAEQKIIAEKLDTLLAQVDSTKARLEQIPQILKRFRQAVLAAAMRGELTEIWRARNSFNLSLQKYYELTKGQKLKAKNISEPCEEKTWLRCNIGHIFNVKSGDGLTAKEMNASGDIPVYGGNGITGYHDKYNTEEPIIVIGRVGYYCGSVHLTPEKSWITDNALLVDFNRELIAKQFAYWLLKATNLRVDTSSSAQPVISGTKIYSIEIVIPPIEEQHEIVRRVEQLFAWADTIEKQVNNALTRVNSLTQSILAKAFRGELTAQWRAENPELISGENSAAALLEKIKAERAASGGKKTSRKKA
ncbi:restriction endonuclease subunit S [Salmonella sp. NW1258]|uniref:Restriction endonuclease subunit S n=1 Tax=Salmonella enterica subsp. enterica serovar Havana TaxID=179997 RepID=A0A3V3CC29_SALET|nr:restriction endonuclease subunit S [Salmonella enterica]EDV8478977.1 restriction endonuclease subunit S [Salmonella enterica subsp. enterica serovar Ohio]EEH7173896.1 restriction endonuclease subunit S [Salmonella enterica subsp. enterica]MBA6279207.1 restriction endonuclease subunit S [Salmonella enterica subsp. enterica serovar Irumu]EAA7456535.1 restriction endonuclease subunit S [Salmonella enterica subsp. enterica serovar Havana]EAA9314471.1 restriction endonuclease subunit S [Salmonel